MRSIFYLILITCVPAANVMAAPIPIANVQRGEPVLFEKDILPILQKSCLACHSASQRQGELILESPDTMRKGGDSGVAIVPGRGAESLLIKVASHQIDPIMPPPGNKVNAPPLTAEELGLLRLWIDQGARGSGQVSLLSPKSLGTLPSTFTPVLTVAVAPDGQSVAASRGNQLFLYRALGDQPPTPLVDTTLKLSDGAPPVAHRDLIESLTFNADGDLLASGSFREAKVWRRPRDVQKAKLALGAPPTAIAVSPDGDWIATSGMTNSIRLWQTQSGQAGAELLGHTDRVTGLRFNANGQLASVSLDQSIRMWRVSDGAPLGLIETPAAQNAVEWIATRPTDSTPSPPAILVTGGADNLLRTWSAPRQVPEKWPLALMDPAAAGQCLFRLRRDRRWALTSDATGGLRLIAFDQDGKATITADWKSDRGAATALEVGGVASGAEPSLVPPAVYVGASDGSISEWRMPGPALTRRWRSAIGPVTALAGSADGKQLVCGYENGTVTVSNLNIESSRELAANNRIDVTAVANHVGRRMLATAGSVAGRPAVLIHHLDGGQILHTLAGHEQPIRAIAFSADAGRMATGSDDLSVRLWDLNNPQPAEVKRLMVPVPSTAIAFSPDMAQLLLAGVDNKVRLFAVADGMLLKEFVGHAGKVLTVGFLAVNQPYSLSIDRSLRFWNPVDGQQVRAIDIPSPPIASCLSADGQQIGVSSEDKLTRVYQLANSQLLQTLTGSTAVANSLQFSPDGKRLVTSAVVERRSDVSLWELEKGRLLEVIETDLNAWVSFEPQADRICLLHGQGLIRTISSTFQRHCDGIQQPITGLAVHNGSRLAIVAAKGGTLQGFQIDNGQTVFSAGHGAPIQSLAISDNEQLLVTGGENGTVRFWQPNGAGAGVQQVSGLASAVLGVAVSPDAATALAAVGGPQPQVVLLDVTSGAILQRFRSHTQPPTAICVVNPGDRLLSISADSAWTWSLHALRTIPGHSGAVTSLAALPDGPMQVLSGSVDTTIRRWNLENGQSVAQFGHGGPVQGVAIRKDGQRFASVSDNNTVKLWNINGQQLAEMRGDIRLRNAVNGLTRQQTAANERVLQSKQRLDLVQKDVPLKTDSSQKATAALAAANADVQQKQTAVTQASDQKLAAELASIAASAEARKMQIAKSTAEKAAKDIEGDMQIGQQKLAQRMAASNAAPNDAALKQAVAESQAAVQASQQKLQQAQQTIQTASQMALTQTTAANEAAQRATTLQKPFNDALATLKTSQVAQRLAMQQNEIATRELQQAQTLVPEVQAAVSKLEAALAETVKQLAAANLAVTQAEQPVRHVAFSPNGRLLATAGEFASVQMWDGETGTAVASYAGHTGPIAGLAFCSDGQLLSGSADQSAVIWDLQPGWRLERTWGAADKPDLISDRVMALDFSPDSTQLLIGGGVPSRNGELHVIELAGGTRMVYLPQAHDDVVSAARFSPDGKRIASAGADKYVRIFDVASAQLLRRFEGHTNYVLGVAWKSDGQTIASAGADNSVKIWEVETGDQRLSIGNFSKHVTGLRFIGDSDNIVTSSGDRLVRMHVAANGGNFRNLSGPKAWLHCIDAAPNNDLVAAGSADGTLYLWNGNTGQPIKSIAVGE